MGAITLGIVCYILTGRTLNMQSMSQHALMATEVIMLTGFVALLMGIIAQADVHKSNGRAIERFGPLLGILGGVAALIVAGLVLGTMP